MRTALRDAYEPLRERPFRLLFASRTISTLGSAFSPVALAFAILELTGSASDLGIVLASAMVPQVLFLLVGGVIADRLPRHRVMVAASFVDGTSQAVLAALLLTGVAEVWHFAALAAVHGASSAFFNPASQGIVPQVVSRARLQEANALLRMSRNATTIGGAAAGGLLVALVGPGWGVALDAATFFAAGLLLLRMPLPATLRMRGTRFWGELHEGWREFSSRTWIWAIVVSFGFINAFFTGAYAVLGPLVADRELGGAAAWGLILSAASAGFLLGSVAVIRIKPRYPMRTGMLTIFLMAAPLVLLAVGAHVAVIALGAALAGFGVEIFGVLWETALQEHIPTEVLSRVAAYDWLGSLALMPIGYAVVGPLSAAIGVEETLWACAGLIALLTALTLASSDVRNLPRRGERAADGETQAVGATA